MNKMLKLALGVVLVSALAVPALAQDNFPDTPDNHWAFEALKNLKDKVLFGYPDGLYRGNRPMSRYEFAAAIHNLYQMMMGKVTGLEDQIAALEKMIKGMPTGPGTNNNAGLQELRDQLAALGRRVGAVESGNAEMKKLVAEFEKEIAGLGVDVDAMKKDISDLDARVKKLEGMKPNIMINGDINLLVLAGHSTDNSAGLAVTGVQYGIGDNAYANRAVGLTRDLNVLHEAAFSISGTNEQGPKWNATLVAGNMLGALGGNAGQNGVGVGTFDDRNTNDIYFQNFSVMFDSALLGQNFSAEIGRVGHSVGAYLFHRPDWTPYYKNDRYDNGKHTFDGGILGFKFGSAKLNVWGGRNETQTMNNNPLNPLGFGQVHQSLGLDLHIPLGSNGKFKAAYIWHDSNNAVGGQPANPNRLNVYGGELSFDLGGIKLMGAYSESQASSNNKKAVAALTDNSAAWDVNASTDRGALGLMVGYRRVEQNFGAEGNWGRFGTVWNPTGFEGFRGKISLKVGGKSTLYAKGEFVEGLDNVILGSVGLRQDDKLTSFKVGFDHALSDVMGLMLSYEDVKWNYTNTANDPTQRWYTVGLNWTMSSNAFLSFMYQFSDANGKGNNLAPVPGSILGGDRFKGGLLGTQLSIKF